MLLSMSHVVSYGLAFVLVVGIALVGERYGATAERTLWRAVYAIGGAFLGLILLGLIWTTISSF
jgi:hypothetical protein